MRVTVVLPFVPVMEMTGIRAEVPGGYIMSTIAPPPSREAEPAPPKAAEGALRILVVEDNEDARVLVCELLGALGHTMEAWALGMLLSCAIGIPVGVLIGLSSWAHAGTREVIDFVRAHGVNKKRPVLASDERAGRLAEVTA